jgi:hypothetical protein
MPVASSPSEGLQAVGSLVELFARDSSRYTATGYLEDTGRTDFIEPFFEALGWDVLNVTHALTHYRDVLGQYEIVIDGRRHWADYSLGIAQARYCIVEAKAPLVSLTRRDEYQARRYGYNSSHRLAVLTNFRELRVFDCEPKPGSRDLLSTALLMRCQMGNYQERWDEIWRLLSRQSVIRGESPDMLKELQEWTSSPEAAGARRRLALARIIATDITQEPAVASFRDEVLGGCLLSPDDVPAWLKEQAAVDGDTTVWFRFPLPRHCPDHDPREPLGKWLKETGDCIERAEQKPMPMGWSVELLEYLVPGSQWVHRMPISHDGILARLKSLAGSLSRKVSVWTEASAVIFCLTGAVPPVPPATIGTSMSVHYPALSRATLKLDPSLSPREVRRLYEEARGMSPLTSPRALSRSDIELSLVTCDIDPQTAEDDELERLMIVWNRDHPTLSYDSVEAFAEAALKARAAVAGWQPAGS